MLMQRPSGWPRSWAEKMDIVTHSIVCCNLTLTCCVVVHRRYRSQKTQTRGDNLYNWRIEGMEKALREVDLSDAGCCKIADHLFDTPPRWSGLRLEMSKLR